VFMASTFLILLFQCVSHCSQVYQVTVMLFMVDFWTQFSWAFIQTTSHLSCIISPLHFGHVFTVLNANVVSYRLSKVQCTPVQALRLCTGCTAPSGGRGIALLFHDHGTRRGWGVSVTPRPLFTPRKDAVSIVQDTVWVPGPVWTGAENLAPTGIRSPDRPAHSQSLYRLRYQTHSYRLVLCIIVNILLPYYAASYSSSIYLWTRFDMFRP
jgi:hypothetical protein